MFVARYQRFVQLYIYASVIGYVGISLPFLNNAGNIAYASVTADVGYKESTKCLSSSPFKLWIRYARMVNTLQSFQHNSLCQGYIAERYGAFFKVAFF